MKKSFAVNKSLYTFLALVTVFAGLSYLLAFSGDKSNIPGGLLLVQFSPAAAAIPDLGSFKVEDCPRLA